MIFEALSYDFFRRALLVGVLAGVTCGVIGTYVVVKRIASISGGVSHAAFGGVGVAYYLGLDPIVGALAFGIASAVLIGCSYFREHQSLDSLIAIVWSCGMALGVLFVALTPGYAPELSGFLFGNILLVSPRYVFVVIALDVVILATVARYFRYFQAVSFDEQFCVVTGVPVRRIFLTLLVLIALAVVLLIRVVGVVLTIALLTMPSVIARQWSDGLKKMMTISAAIASTCTVLGLFLCYYLADVYSLNTPAGPLIILVTSFLYLASLAASRHFGKKMA